MRAVIRTGLLGTTISFRTDQPPPASLDTNSPLKNPTDVLIKVKSAAINPVDYKLPRLIGGKVVGIDVSGEVVKIGNDVTEFNIGDEVFGRAMSGGRFVGSLSEYAEINSEEVAQKPDSLQFDEAAAIPTAYLTGLQSLRAGVQLANGLGATRIVGICSGKNFEFVQEMSGIKKEDNKLELVDYTDDTAMDTFMKENVGKFDCIYDTATGSGKGEAYIDSMMHLLKENTGEYTQINGPPGDWARLFSGKMKPHRTLILTGSNGRSELEEIAKLLSTSVVKPHLNEFTFDEKGVADGFELLKSRRTKGKIVFNMN